MTSNLLAVCTTAAVLWLSCATADVFPAVGQDVSTNTPEELSLADISRVIEAQGLLMSSGSPFDLLGALISGNDGGDPIEGKIRLADTPVFDLCNQTEPKTLLYTY